MCLRKTTQCFHLYGMSSTKKALSLCIDVEKEKISIPRNKVFLQGGWFVVNSYRAPQTLEE